MTLQGKPQIQELQRQAKLLLRFDQSGEDAYIRLRVISDSMAPMLEPGDYVLVTKVEASGLRRGDLVVVRHADDFITHRLLRLEAAGIQTKGDRHILADPLVSLDLLLGKVAVIHHQEMVRDLSVRYWRIANRWLGWLSELEMDAFRAGGRWLSWPFRLVFWISKHLVVKIK